MATSDSSIGTAGTSERRTPGDAAADVDDGECAATAACLPLRVGDACLPLDRRLGLPAAEDAALLLERELAALAGDALASDLAGDASSSSSHARGDEPAEGAADPVAEAGRDAGFEPGRDAAAEPEAVLLEREAAAVSGDASACGLAVGPSLSGDTAAAVGVGAPSAPDDEAASGATAGTGSSASAGEAPAAGVVAGDREVVDDTDVDDEVLLEALDADEADEADDDADAERDWGDMVSKVDGRGSDTFRCDAQLGAPTVGGQNT